MASIQVRSATQDELPQLAAFDAGYSTDYVWQMDLRDESSAGQIAVTFRPVRLPRPMRVTLAREPERLLGTWSHQACFLVAEQDGQARGYLNLVLAPAPETAWVSDLVVERRFRRGGVGLGVFTPARQRAGGIRPKRRVSGEEAQSIQCTQVRQQERSAR